MKNLKNLILTVLFVVFSLAGTKAQQTDVTRLNLHPTPLQISNNKTTSVVFSSAIQSVDRGSQDLLVQRSPGTQNVLQLKAAKIGFDETNLTVVLADGKLHSFLVGFSMQPDNLLLSISEENNAGSPVGKQEGDNSVSELEKFAKEALARIDKSVKLRMKKHQFILELKGVFIRGDHMFLHILLENRGYIPYDIQRLALVSKENRLSKRSASQELLISPAFTLGKISKVESRSEHHMVLCVPKMTLQDKKHLSLELTEHSGGRHLKLKIKNKHLLKAVPLLTY